MRIVSQTLVALVLVVRVAAPVSAQAQPPAPPPVSFGSLFSDLGHDLTRLPSKANALTIGIGGALALAVHPADGELTRRATLSLPLDYAFEVGEPAGSGWLQAGGALGTFLIGKATGSPRAQVVGADLVRAQMINAVITQGVKFAVGRSRPNGGRYSFPSGHTSATFASATVLHKHFGWKAGVPAYGLAAYVGASRLQENRHYASDVIFGAALGIVAGRTVTVGRGSNQFVVAPIAVPGGAGVLFTLVQ